MYFKIFLLFLIALLLAGPLYASWPSSKVSTIALLRLTGDDKKSHKKSKKHHQDAFAQVIGAYVLPETSLPCHCVIVTAMTFD